MSWIIANYTVILVAVVSVIGGASVIVRAIAPLTKSTADNKVAKVLGKIHGWLSKIAMNPKKDVE